MAHTFFKDFTKDNGVPVTVEFSASGGEPNFDYPGHICDGGGSGPEICILRSWPNNAQYEWWCSRQVAIQWSATINADAFLSRLLLAGISLRQRQLEIPARLTDAELERMEAWLAERHEDEHDYDD